MPPRRIVFVINSNTGGELRAGNRDAARIFAVLTDPVLGACSPESPPPLHSCSGYAEFHTTLLALLEGWRGEDQLVFYFSGHGNVIKGQYCLQTGTRRADNVPFANILNLFVTHGVTRAIIIIDACHSGAALGVKSGTAHINVAPEDSIPQGIAILASSRTSEQSHELPDGAGSVFTTLLCDGIESGLDNTPTEDNLIGVDAIINYVGKKLQEARYAEFVQNPMYTVNRANRSIWLARNRTTARPTSGTARVGLSSLGPTLAEGPAPGSSFKPAPSTSAESASIRPRRLPITAIVAIALMLLAGGVIWRAFAPVRPDPEKDIRDFSDRVLAEINSIKGGPLPVELNSKIRAQRDKLNDELDTKYSNADAAIRRSLQANLAWAFAHDGPNKRNLTRARQLAESACGIDGKGKSDTTGCLALTDVLMTAALLGDDAFDREVVKRTIAALDMRLMDKAAPAVEGGSFNRARLRMSTDLAALNIELARTMGGDAHGSTYCMDARARIKDAYGALPINPTAELDNQSVIAVADFEVQVIAFDRICGDLLDNLSPKIYCDSNPDAGTALAVERNCECLFWCVTRTQGARAPSTVDASADRPCRYHRERARPGVEKLAKQHPLYTYKELFTLVSSVLDTGVISDALLVNISTSTKDRERILLTDLKARYGKRP